MKTMPRGIPSYFHVDFLKFGCKDYKFVETLSSEELERFAIAKKEDINIEHHIFIAKKK